MRSVEVLISCDACYVEKGVKVPATGTLIYGVKYGGSVGYVVELCDEHQGTVRVADLLVDGEQRVGKPYVPPVAERPPRAAHNSAAAARRELPQVACPFCDKDAVQGVGIAIHVKSMHPEYFQPKTDWSMVTFDGKRVRGIE